MLLYGDYVGLYAWVGILIYIYRYGHGGRLARLYGDYVELYAWVDILIYIEIRA